MGQGGCNSGSQGAECGQVGRQLAEKQQLDRILLSRMVRRWKPTEQPGGPAVRKSRWCLRGDKDPDVLNLECYEQCSMRYVASVGGLKNAFLPVHALDACRRTTVRSSARGLPEGS